MPSVFGTNVAPCYVKAALNDGFSPGTRQEARHWVNPKMKRYVSKMNCPNANYLTVKRVLSRNIPSSQWFVFLTTTFRSTLGEKDMRKDTTLTVTGKQYAEAHAAHYTTKDLHKALDLYKGVMAAHPNTEEAEYSRTQMQNIVKSVVPKQNLLDAQVALALTCLRSPS